MKWIFSLMMKKEIGHPKQEGFPYGRPSLHFSVISTTLINQKLYEKGDVLQWQRM